MDGFRDLRVGAVEDPDFGAAIDKSRTVATPSVTQFPIDLKVDSSTGANVYQDVVTLADTGTRVTVIDQPFATNFRNCVSNFYNYAGKSAIDPPFDAGYDVIQNPAINLEVDIATPLLDLVDNLQEVLPLTREQVSSIAGAVQRNGRNRSQTTTVTTTTDTLEVGDNNVTTSSVGNFVTDVTMSPYIQSREVKILVTGLRPNTRHYFFLDGASIDSHIYPGDVNPTVVGSATEYNVSEVEDNGSAKGSSVRTDAEGTLAAVFDIPEATFFVGERAIEIADVDQYSSLESGKTSYSKAVYRAYNFDVGKSELTQTTRTPTFDVERNVTTRSFTRQWRVDPIAQTFIVRPAQAEGASMSMISSVDVYFKSKSATVGATLELREVVNGYPSQAVLPFGRKHLRASQINTSDDGTTATTFQFKNPVKLNVNKEYCFVVIPDANSPDFLIFTSKVGNADLATGTSITNDWGDGVLFTSTNDSAWKSYQDEDIKFTLKRYQHQATAGSVDLSPNDVEFLSVENTTLNFKNDELAYVKKSYSKPCGVTNRTVTIDGGSIFAVGDYILIVNNNDNFLSEVVAVNDTASILTIRTPYNGTTNSATAFLTVTGRVSYFNKRKADRLFLKASSAKEGNFLVTGEVVNGYRTGATTSISTIDNEPISYFQPQIFVSNSMRTSTDFTLYNGSAVDKSISLNGNVYSTGNLRVVNSTSNIVNPGLTESNDFKIRVAMTNNGYQSSTPIVDPALSILNAYKYKISASSAATSSWVSKEVTLQEQLDATGLRVYLSGFRPAGTYIDVYARFVYPTDIETQSDWIKLVNSDEDMYSNVSNTLDYREFQYDLQDETNDYSSFQLKFEMRHATSSEINTNDLNVTPAEHIFPHIYDYRAIALT